MVCITKVSYISSLNSCNEERSGNIKRKKLQIQIHRGSNSEEI
jgi:hypothetical protein